jgi:hypothetical protein
VILNSLPRRDHVGPMARVGRRITPESPGSGASAGRAAPAARRMIANLPVRPRLPQCRPVRGCWALLAGQRSCPASRPGPPGSVGQSECPAAIQADTPGLGQCRPSRTAAAIMIQLRVADFCFRKSVACHWKLLARASACHGRLKRTVRVTLAPGPASEGHEFRASLI